MLLIFFFFFFSRAKYRVGGWGAEFNFSVGSDFSQLEVVMDKSQPWKGSSSQPAGGMEP